MMRESNERKFEHQCRNGSVFMADRCDMKTGATMYVPPGISAMQLAADAMQAGGFHAANILPGLSRFDGYDTVEITIYTNDP